MSKPKQIDLQATWNDYKARHMNPGEASPLGEIFIEVTLLAGMAMALQFMHDEGPKGSRGFVKPSRDALRARMLFLNELSLQIEQDQAAFANADNE